MSARLRSSTRASTAASDFLEKTQSEIKSTKSAGDTRKSSSSVTRQLRGSELAKLKRIASFAFIVGISLLGGLLYLILNEKVALYPKTIKTESLAGFTSRAEYALRFQTLLFGWLIFNVHYVIYVRLTKLALNPLVDSTEKHCQASKNILTNSFEQIFLSVILQLIFVSFANATLTLQLIPIINIIQLIGRITFFFGYPYYRTFGVTLTLFPNSLLTAYVLYKFSIFAGLYTL